MDFKDILEAWERRKTGSTSSAAPDMEELISRYPPTGPKDSREDSRREQRNQPGADPQATLDLHGMTSREAEQALEDFVLRCRRRGLGKVLIVHGKGHHSRGEPVLQRVVRLYLEKSPYTGAFGPADRRHGGRGATWVMLRKA
jgi:DNA-nicking Smr family endonuclease